MTVLYALVLSVAVASGPPEAVEAPEAPEAPAPSASSGSPADRFAEGNRRYLQGQYTDALRVYAELLEEAEVEDPVLYHNLGNACFRSGAYGLAILYYQRGLRLDPPADVGDSLRANLDSARRALQARYRSTGDKSQFVYAEAGGLVYKVTHVLGRTTPAVLFGALWGLLMVLLILRRLRPAARVYGRVAVFAALAAGLAALLFWGQVYTDASYRVGVVVVDGAKLRDGKHPEAQGRDIPEGLEVRIVEQDDGWTRVELNNGRQGWVEAEVVRQI